MLKSAQKKALTHKRFQSRNKTKICSSRVCTFTASRFTSVHDKSHWQTFCCANMVCNKPYMSPLKGEYQIIKLSILSLCLFSLLVDFTWTQPVNQTEIVIRQRGHLFNCGK